MGHFASAAQPLEFWLAIALGAIVAVASFYGAFVYLRRKRLIEDTPKSRIRSAAQGYVELQGIGTLLPGEPITAPLTDLPCLWYRSTIAERKRGVGKRNEHWQIIEEHVSEALFQLEDETGSCVVDPSKATCVADQSKTWYGRHRHPLRDDGGAATAAAVRLLLGRRRYRYQEQRISVDHPLYVLGWFRTVSADTAGSDPKAAQRELLREWKQDRAGLLARFDLNDDSRIDQSEWETARSFARNQVEQELREERRKPAVHIVSNRADRDRPYLISTRAENQLTTRYSRYFVTLLGIALGVGALLTYLIGMRTL